MADDTDDQLPEPLEEIAGWLLANGNRQTWEVLQGLAKDWPDVTAKEILVAWIRMSILAEKPFDKEVQPIKNRSQFKVIEGGGDTDDE